jgi:transcriptional regulator with XRE-family HTH domain
MKFTNEDYQRKQFLALLKKIRQEKGLRQVELAEKLGVPQSFVSKYEAGDRRLDLLELRQVCLILGISLANLVQELEKNLHETE